MMRLSSEDFTVMLDYERHFYTHVGQCNFFPRPLYVHFTALQAVAT
jgi:hypothetical protein